MLFKDENIDPSKGGRTPYKKMVLFKGIVIQALYNLSDEQLEFQIVDRASFKRFLGIKCCDKVPDSRTFWAFREQLIKKDLISQLFEIFKTALETAGVIANEGQIIDASFVDVPRQRNNREENKHIKDTGTAPEEWTKKPRKLAQKDIDARWTKKNNSTFFGYKNHVKVDAKTKFITDFVVTDASVHDSQVIGTLLTERDKEQPLYADSAYTGEKQEKIYEEKKVIPRINEKVIEINLCLMNKRPQTKKNHLSDRVLSMCLAL